MGLLHGALANRNDGIKVVGIVDPSSQSRMVAKGIGIRSPILRSVDSAIKLNSPGIAIICTPPSSHFELAKKFLINGWGVFVEKPLTMDNNKSQSLAEIAEQNRLYNQVGFQLRFSPVFLYLRRQIEEKKRGGVGVRSIHISILSPQFSQIEDSLLGSVRGGVAWDLLPHIVDMSFFLTEVSNYSDIAVKDVETVGWKAIAIKMLCKEVKCDLLADWGSMDVRKVETTGQIEMDDGSEYQFDSDKVWMNGLESYVFHRRMGENPYFEIADHEYSFQMQHISESFVSGESRPAADFQSGLLVDSTIENIMG